jgi:hypothetical protein
MRQQTSVINAIRVHLAEFAIVAPVDFAQQQFSETDVCFTPKSGHGSARS